MLLCSWVQVSTYERCPPARWSVSGNSTGKKAQLDDAQKWCYAVPVSTELTVSTPGVVLPIMDYTGRLRPKGLTQFSRLEEYKRVGISRAEV